MTGIVKKFDALEISEFFADVPIFVRESVVSSARLRNFTCRQLMFVTDDRMEETFLLVEGCAKVAQLTRIGEEVVLRIAAPGELVGELGLAPGAKHSSTAQALEDCQALAWPTDAFEAALIRFPILQRNVNNILGRRISEIQSRISRTCTQLAPARLAQQLMCLADQMGKKVDTHVEIKIAQEALAQMTAMGLWTTNRILSGWESQGFLRVHRLRIEIHDSPGLSGLCM
jgi:CRP/FNR family transcriptional regulator, cyclic AMP receptor protein